MKKKVVVIGGGLAGSLISNQLAGKGEVTLLEIGQEHTFNTPNIFYKRKKLAQVATFCHGGGGTTNLWHNGLIPIHEKDVATPDFAEILTDAKRFIDEAASALYFPENSYLAEYAKISAEINALVDELSVFKDGVDCLIYPKKFKKLSLVKDVDAHYSVRNIEFVPGERRIKTVKFTKGRNEYAIDPDVVIVSAGALGTPGILKEIIDSTGDHFPSLGTGFIDHPIGFVGKVKFCQGVSEIFSKLSICDLGNYISRNAIRIKSACGKYTCCVFFRPAFTMHNSLVIYKYKSLLGASKGVDRLKNLLSFKVFHPDILAEIIAHLTSLQIPGRIYNIFFVAEQRRGNNRVFYENGKLIVDWCITDEELTLYRQSLVKLNGMLSGISEELDIKTDITEDWLWSAAHHSCTSPLGNTDLDLIDKDLKLKFCDNVYVCDGSVIQEHSYANTGLAIAQMSLRLSEKILKSFIDC